MDSKTELKRRVKEDLMLALDCSEPDAERGASWLLRVWEMKPKPKKRRPYAKSPLVILD
ncbi:MAG: hypothetical protein IT444_11470 [Phycisphaeraceae bacterium]|nr:hypothetical protein [Phycisphaeraceae bacterium]